MSSDNNQVGKTTAAQQAQVEGGVRLPRRLTAENGAKALLIGEFYETCRVVCPRCNADPDWGACNTCNSEGYITQRVAVQWDTIKRIYDKIVEHFAT